MPKTINHPCITDGCAGVISWPVQRGRRPMKCDTCKGATTVRRQRIRQAKTTGAGVGTIAAPVTVATVATKATSADPVADAAQAAQAAVDALAAAVAERDAKAAQGARAPFPTPTGAHYAFADLLLTLQAGEQPYLCGPSGSGKSHAAAQAAKILGLSFRFMSCSPTIGGHVFFGYMSATGTYVPGIIREAWEFGGVVLIDEIDACASQALVELNGALALQAGAEFTFPDGACIPRHADFYVVAAGNTTGNGADDVYNGREQLDGASLTRFVVIEWGYDESLERQMVPAEHVPWAERVIALRKAAKAAGQALLITPRATLAGARLLSVGMPQAKVEDMTVWKLCGDDVRRAVLAHV